MLSTIDDSFNMMSGDIKLGGLRILMTESAIGVEDSSGSTTYKSIFDKNVRQLITNVGEVGIDGQSIFQEFNPQLRVNEQLESIKALLNLISAKAGLGFDKYSFSQGQVTATAMKIFNADQTRNISKHRLIIESFLLGIIRAVIILKFYNEKKVDIDSIMDNISIGFDDNIFNDKNQERRDDMALVEANLMTREQFIIKWINGVSEDNVQEYITKLDTDKGFTPYNNGF
jgi:A118 family predicted phage portal protein